MMSLPFPLTSIIDDFNRANEGPPMTGWTDILNGLEIINNQAADSGGAGMSWSVWSTLIPAANCEAYFTIATVGDGQDFIVFARVTGSGGSLGGYAVNAQRTSGRIEIYRIDGWVFTTLDYVDLAVGDGDGIGIRCLSDVIYAYHKPAAGVWAYLFSATDSTYTVPGLIGTGIDDPPLVEDARIDNFGGGDLCGATVVEVVVVVV
jgi:hypothetical protein